MQAPGPPRVGRYGVDLRTFERVALPALRAAGRDAVVVVDELGKMELASAAFREAVTDLLRRVAGVGADRYGKGGGDGRGAVVLLGEKVVGRFRESEGEVGYIWRGVPTL